MFAGIIKSLYKQVWFGFVFFFSIKQLQSINSTSHNTLIIPVL